MSLEQVPVLSEVAKGFGVFDHWFSEVPSQTFTNRSFWTAGTSSGLVVNSPTMKWTKQNTAETLFDRLEAHGRTWKVYVLEPARLSFTGWIHMPRLKDRLATNIVPFSEFERGRGQRDAARLQPDRANLSPPARRLPPRVGQIADRRRRRHRDRPAVLDPRRRGLPGAHLRGDPIHRLHRRVKRLQHDVPYRLGRARRHLRPRPSRSGAAAGPRAPAGECDFTFDRSGYRVPAIIVSPWIDEGTVINDEYRHTSLLATLRKGWDLGDPFSERDAAAPTFDHLLARETPRDRGLPDVHPRPVPEWQRPRSNSVRR